MKILLTAAVLLVSSLPAGAIDFTRIQSERAFRTFVVDHTLVDEFGGRLQLGANGSLSGQVDSSDLRGGWIWRDGQVCRRLIIGPVDQGTECHTVFIRANQLVFERPSYGQSLSYTISASR